MANIRQVDFRNFTYRLEWNKEKEIIQLRDGGWIRPDGAEFGLQRITFGDLTSDGSEEAIILLRVRTLAPVAHWTRSLFTP